MTEDNLHSKMTEFMTALDQVKKYREIVASMTDFTIIIMGTIAAGLEFNNVMRLSNLFIWADHGQNILAYFLFSAIFPAGAIIAVWWVRRRMKKLKAGQWKNTLNEGASGALQLIQEIEWEKIFGSIRYAKLGFFIYGIAKILACWGIATVGLFAVNWLVDYIFHMSMDLGILLAFALVIDLFFNRNSLRKRYEQIGRLDWLLWELRWFESEFRGADFEA